MSSLIVRKEKELDSGKNGSISATIITLYTHLFSMQKKNSEGSLLEKRDSNQNEQNEHYQSLGEYLRSMYGYEFIENYRIQYDNTVKDDSSNSFSSFLAKGIFISSLITSFFVSH